ncbi:NADH dehydrogenase subunit L [Colwellia chukchiensis]|uniref:NADH dehydrogenase subunit L n=1 Tax=Colwellia chukchiensis TaxID=641665 RepID=A0A1H7H0V7_9GAMM|nr:NADH-quinone oxidoreductase subunit L [Colwellia chukchiensis]SEK43878.1 NADH dehydrogenase subunit L [Colwellia chukchiensis]
MLLASVMLYPLLSFLFLVSFAKKLSWPTVATISVASIGLSALASGLLVWQLSASDNQLLTVTLWHWFDLNSHSGSSAVNIGFYLDGLSGVMISVVTGVGFLIHLFAAIYMKADKNFARFMAYMNLFIFAMLILVLADNLVLLYLGWEGVGLCSFLLIGFWYQEKSNVLAARKAFIVTRVGDTSMAIALFLLFSTFGTLDIELLSSVLPVINGADTDAVLDDKLYWIALLLLGGAVGKSAQLPLQTWLPDAMAGPTPVSALIHAATMVTAGVYLIARLHHVFLLTPEVMHYIAWLGAITLLLAGVAALAQNDIKRVLAYSTMSQIGYMMLALGAGAWSAGAFHLMTHAFFKALLFLTAGSIIYALHHQQNLFKMGGLLQKAPFESALFIIGLICLMALPGSSGFFSKEAIIAQLWSSDTAGPMLWWCAILGALLTSLYSCRLFFLGFLGRARFSAPIQAEKHILLRAALVALAILSLLGGLIPLELSLVFPNSVVLASKNEPSWLHTVAILTPFIGILAAWLYFKPYRLASSDNKQVLGMHNGKLAQFCQQGLGFDSVYNTFIVQPYMWLAKRNKNDIFDQIMMLNTWYVGLWHDAIIMVQNGSLRWYLAAFGIAILLLTGVILL